MKDKITKIVLGLSRYIDKCYYVLCFLPFILIGIFYPIKVRANQALFYKWKSFYELKVGTENLDVNVFWIICIISIALWIFSFVFIMSTEDSKSISYVKIIRFIITITLLCFLYKTLYAITAIIYHIFVDSLLKIATECPEELVVVYKIQGVLNMIINVLTFILAKYFYMQKSK